jgi:hypothetical protein
LLLGIRMIEPKVRHDALFTNRWAYTLSADRMLP